MRNWIWGLLVAVAFSRTGRAEVDLAGQPAGDSDLPKKWFQGARGYEKALELQKVSKSDILVYFSRPNTPDEKGLCHWFENKGLASLPVRQLLRDYLKVEVPLPGNPENQKLAETFRVRKTPAVFIVQPDGWRNRCRVFDWENKRPKLPEPEELARRIRVNSSPKYHLPGDLPEKTGVEEEGATK